MKRLKMTFILLIGSILCILAQKDYTLQCQLVTIDGAPIEFAVARILQTTDSSFVQGAISDTLGKIFLKIEKGNYILSLSDLNHVPRFISFKIDTLDIDLSKIILVNKVNVIDLITIEAERPQIEYQSDKVVFTLPSSSTALGLNSIEVLQHVPFVSVDQDGNIQLQGRQGVRIFINDKPSYLTGQELLSYLRSLPAHLIKKVEVMSQPSSKYDAAGNAGILNIVFKNDQTKKYHISFNHSLQQGRMPRWLNGITFNYNKPRWSLFTQLNHTRNERWNNESYRTTMFDHTDTTIFNSNEKASYFSHAINSRSGAEYQISPKATLGVIFSYYAGIENQSAHGIQTNNLNNYLLHTIIESHATDLKKFTNSIYSAYFSYVFDSLGKKLNCTIDRAVFTNAETPYIISLIENTGIQEVTQQKINSKQLGDIKILSSGMDYIHPIVKNATFSTGFKWTMTQTDNDLFFQINNKIDLHRTNQYIYNESILAAYVDYNHQVKSWNFKMGLRYENTFSTGDQKSNNIRFDKSYSQLFPTLFVQYKWKNNNRSSLSFSRRIQRPDFESLNPFVYISNPYTSWGGNPDLLPSFTNSMQLQHILKNKISIFLNNSVTDQLISPIQYRDTMTGGVFSTQGNIMSSNSQTIGCSASASINKNWMMSMNAVVFRNSSKGTIQGEIIKSSLISYRIFTNHRFKINQTVHTDLSFWYRPSSLWGATKTGPLGNFSLGFSKNILKQKAHIQCLFNDIFGMQIMKTLVSYPSLQSSQKALSENRSIRLSFIWSFGKSDYKSNEDRESKINDETNRIKSN